MTDDGIREGHLVLCQGYDREGTLIIREHLDGSIGIDGHAYERYLTPAQARYVARKLYRLARRIDLRSEQPA